MRCASVTSKENNVRATGYIYSTEIPSFSLGSCKTDGFLHVSCKHCVRHAGCPSPPFSPFNERSAHTTYWMSANKSANISYRRTLQKRENSYPQLYTTRAVISLPYIFVLVFTCFLYAVPCCIEHIYRPSFVYFLFSMTTSFGLYGVLSSYKYQSWVGACDIRRDPFPCVIVPHQFKIALEAGVA